MIDSLLDACEFILNNLGEPQASEADVRDALLKDIANLGDSSRFVCLADDEFVLRSWTTA